MLLAVLLAACSNNDVPAPATHLPYTVPLTHGWQFQWSPGLSGGPAVSGSSWWFDFPVAARPSTTAVHMVAVPQKLNLKVGTTLVTTYTITASDDAVWDYNIDGTNTCLGNPAHPTLFLQREGDDWSAVSEKAFYRWYNSPALIGVAEYAFGTGTKQYTQSMPLDLKHWGGVTAQQGTVAQLADALAHLANVGIVFGGGCAAGHGLRLIAGAARFTMSLYEFK
jgi:hypothetical protein